MFIALIFIVLLYAKAINQPLNESKLEAQIYSEFAQHKELLNNKSFELFSKSGSHPNKFICLNPNAGMYGGWGNLVNSLISIIGFSLTTQKQAIMNHPLFLEMFNHPDERQKWNLWSAEEIRSIKHNVGRPPARCGDINHMPLNTFEDKYGVNGCLSPYLTHPAAINYFQFLLHKKYDKILPNSYFTQVSNILAQWIFSNPTKKYKEMTDEHKKQLLSNECGENFDLAVQFRSWRDVRAESATFGELDGSCVLECALERVSWLKQKITNRKICVFVTTDNSTSSNIIVNAINALSTKDHAVHAITFIDTHLEKHWHSMGVVQDTRFFIEPTELSRHPELLDWYLIGDAYSAVYTAGSTFAFTSRMRSGILNQMNDYAVNKVDNKCVCEKVMPNFPIDEQIDLRNRLLLEFQKRKL
jgi:hypothetical protein